MPATAIPSPARKRSRAPWRIISLAVAVCAATVFGWYVYTSQERAFKAPLHPHTVTASLIANITGSGSQREVTYTAYQSVGAIMKGPQGSEYVPVKTVDGNIGCLLTHPERIRLAHSYPHPVTVRCLDDSFSAKLLLTDPLAGFTETTAAK